MTDRRSALGLLTKGAAAVGVLAVGAGLARSCSPPDQHITRVDLSDMSNGEVRLYQFGAYRQFILRRAEHLVLVNGNCPVDPPFGWIEYYSGANDPPVFRCPRCTSRFDLNGEITQFWSSPTPPDDAPNLKSDRITKDGLTLLIAENQSVPTLLWSSL